MKQAIQEGFILDVLKSYTPVDSYYKLLKTVEGDPEFDARRPRKSCASMWRATVTPSGIKLRSWSTTFSNR